MFTCTVWEEMSTNAWWWIRIILTLGGRVFPCRYNFGAVNPTWYLSLCRNQVTLFSIRGSEFKGHVIPSKHCSCKGFGICNLFSILNIFLLHADTIDNIYRRLNSLRELKECQFPSFSIKIQKQFIHHLKSIFYPELQRFPPFPNIDHVHSSK